MPLARLSAGIRPPTPPFIIARTDGRVALSGADCSRLCGRCPKTLSTASTLQGPPLGGRRKRGAEAQAIGRSRSGRTTKIRVVCDALGRPIALEVTSGQLGDVRAAIGLIGQLPPARNCAADTAYDSDALRQFLHQRGTRPVIPTTRPASASTRSIATPANDAT